MLSELQVRCFRAALRLLPEGQGSMAVCALTVVLADEPASSFPPSNEAAKPEAPAVAHLLDTIAAHERTIADLQGSLQATRERADAAEVKYVTEVRKHG